MIQLLLLSDYLRRTILITSSSFLNKIDNYHRLLFEGLQPVNLNLMLLNLK